MSRTSSTVHSLLTQPKANMASWSTRPMASTAIQATVNMAIMATAALSL